jgi:putative transcriptional regulator
MANGKGPKNAMLSLGYSGWGPGQLEAEIQSNSWLTTPVDQQILFSPDIDKKWQRSAQLIGIDIHQISSLVGHA